MTAHIDSDQTMFIGKFMHGPFFKYCGSMPWKRKPYRKGRNITKRKLL